MSYDISLLDPVTRETIELKEPHFMQGGTYQLGGCTELWLNITFNYGNIYRRSDVFGENGIHILHGMTALESIPILESATAVLNNDVVDDYWQCTEGNAKRPLCQLLTMAKMRPDGIWEVSY